MNLPRSRFLAAMGKKIESFYGRNPGESDLERALSIAREAQMHWNKVSTMAVRTELQSVGPRSHRPPTSGRNRRRS